MKKKKILIIGNWKCNPPSLCEAEKIFLSIEKKVIKKRKLEVGICPPFVYIFPLAKLNKRKKIVLGAQDVFFEEKGAFTGQISPKMIKDLGCKYVIVGHSEKRMLGERDEIINQKIRAVLKAKLTPILCVGESKEERKGGVAFEKIKNQIQKGLKNILKKDILRTIIAYEPVWAIGTKKPCKPDEVLSMVIYIRKILSRTFNIKKPQEISILYGGSVSEENAKIYVREAQTDGLLVGGNSLKPEKFCKIISSFY